MNADQIVNLAYLGILIAVIGGWFFMQNRRNLGQLAQAAIIWVLIFLGVIAAYGLWSDIRNEVAPQQMLVGPATVEVPQSRDGHFYLTLALNGVPVDFVVDTGATDIVLSREDAARIGLHPETLNFLGTAQTANGAVRIAPVRVDSVVLGDIVDTDVRAVVNDGEVPGSLLGMAYLNRFDRIEIADGKLILTR